MPKFCKIMFYVIFIHLVDQSSMEFLNEDIIFRMATSTNIYLNQYDGCSRLQIAENSIDYLDIAVALTESQLMASLHPSITNVNDSVDQDNVPSTEHRQSKEELIVFPPLSTINYNDLLGQDFVDQLRIESIKEQSEIQLPKETEILEEATRAECEPFGVKEDQIAQDRAVSDGTFQTEYDQDGIKVLEDQVVQEGDISTRITQIDCGQDETKVLENQVLQASDPTMEYLQYEIKMLSFEKKGTETIDQQLLAEGCSNSQNFDIASQEKDSSRYCKILQTSDSTDKSVPMEYLQYDIKILSFEDMIEFNENPEIIQYQPRRKKQLQSEVIQPICQTIIADSCANLDLKSQEKFEDLSQTTDKDVKQSVYPYHCNYCGQKFRYISRLKIHHLTHLDSDIYNCGICGKEFEKHWRYSLHLATHHLE